MYASMYSNVYPLMQVFFDMDMQEYIKTRCSPQPLIMKLRLMSD